jgi:hypothetical protein
MRLAFSSSVTLLFALSFGLGTFKQTIAALDNVVPTDESALEEEVGIARMLFFQLFVEAVVRTVGEAEVWLIEEGPSWRRLYRWKRQ